MKSSVLVRASVLFWVFCWICPGSSLLFALAPRSTLDSARIFFAEFSKPRSAFPDLEAREAFQQWVQHNHFRPPATLKWVERKKEDLAGYRFEYSDSLRILVAEDITLLEVLKLEQEYLDRFSKSLWVPVNDARWSLERMVQSSCRVLGAPSVLRRLLTDSGIQDSGKLAVLEGMGSEIARGFQNLLYPGTNSDFPPFGGSGNPVVEEEILRVKSFLFKNPDRDMETLFRLVGSTEEIRNNGEKLLAFLTERFRSLLLDYFEETLLLHGIGELEGEGGERTTGEFHQRFKNDVLKTKAYQNWLQYGNNLEREQELLKEIFFRIQPYITSDPNFSVRDILQHGTFQCVGTALLCGKLLQDLGFRVFWLNVSENTHWTPENHASLLLESPNGKFLMFDPAMNLFQEVELQNGVQERLNRGLRGDEAIHVFSQDRESNRVELFQKSGAELDAWKQQLREVRRRAAADLFQDREKYLLHPHFQILSFADGYSMALQGSIAESLLNRSELNADVAIRIYEKLIRKNPLDPLLRAALGKAYALSSDGNKRTLAWGTLMEADKMAPDHPKILAYFGELAGRSGIQRQTAVQKLEKAKLLDPENHVTIYNLAMAYREMGNDRQALENLILAFNIAKRKNGQNSFVRDTMLPQIQALLLRVSDFPESSLPAILKRSA